MKNLDETVEALELSIASFQRAFKFFFKENGDIDLALKLTEAWWRGTMSCGKNNDIDDLEGLL